MKKLLSGLWIKACSEDGCICFAIQTWKNWIISPKYIALPDTREKISSTSKFLVKLLCCFWIIIFSRPRFEEDCWKSCTSDYTLDKKITPTYITCFASWNVKMRHRFVQWQLWQMQTDFISLVTVYNLCAAARQTNTSDYYRSWNKARKKVMFLDHLSLKK